MKKVILLILFGLSCMAGYAQSGELYFCMTMQEGVQPQDQTEGIYKSVDKDNSSLYKSESVFVRLQSEARNIHISFGHINYDTSEMVRRNMAPKWDSTMEIKTVDSHAIESQTVYDLDAFFKTYSREQLIDWFESLDIRNKKIYFFDRRDIATGKITLVQVKLIDYGRGY